jgi:MFS transporter, putative metabolite:H+ symporter
VLAEQWGLGTSGKALVISFCFAGMFFGASVLGTVADRMGRRKTFLLTLLVYSGFTLAAAASPNLTWLAILRFCSGFGLGAELSLADSYLSEILPKQVRGRWMASAYTLGFFGVPLAAFIGAKFVASEDLLIDGWRWLLIVGSLGALVVRAAPQPARVAALARDPRRSRGGRPLHARDRGSRHARAAPRLAARARAGRGRAP